MSSEPDPAKVDLAFLAVAQHGGNATKAADELDVTATTVRSWLKRWPDRYSELQQRHRREIEDELVESTRRTALLAAEVEQKALEATLVELDAKRVREPHQAAKNAALTKGVNVDKLLTLTGRATTIVQHQNPDQLLQALNRILDQHAIPSTAVEFQGEIESQEG